MPRQKPSSLYTNVTKPVIPAGIAGAEDRKENPDYMDVFKLAIHGTGYPLPSGYNELPAYLCITMRAKARERP